MAVRDAYYPLGITLVVVDGLAVALRIWARKVKGSIGYGNYTMGWRLSVSSCLSPSCSERSTSVSVRTRWSHTTI